MILLAPEKCTEQIEEVPSRKRERGENKRSNGEKKIELATWTMKEGERTFKDNITTKTQRFKDEKHNIQRKIIRHVALLKFVCVATKDSLRRLKFANGRKMT